MADVTTKITFNADTGSVDKAVSKMGADLRKIEKDAQLAQKGIADMFKGEAFETAASKFAGVQQAVDRYIKTMSRNTTVKQELKATTQVATELEAAWRKMSDAEKQSAEGQELRSKIDALISKAGDLKDTMGDVSGAISKMSSDTRGLDVAVQALGAMSAAAQVVTGSLTAMGVEQSKVAEVQQKMTSLIAITNGLKTIENALQKESALMMKLSQIAAQGLNATIKANPIGAFVTVLVAAGAALYQFALKAEIADQAQHDLSEEIKTSSGEYAKNRVKLTELVEAWKSLSSEMEKNQFIKDNQEEFAKLGVQVDNVGDAENLLVNNTNSFISAMKHRARAAAYAALAVKAFQEEIEATEQGNDRMKNQTTSDRVWGFLNMDWSFDMDESIRREQRMGANAYYHQAGTARSRGERYLQMQKEEEDAAAADMRSGGFRSYSKGGGKTSAKGGKAGGKSNKKLEEVFPEFSEQWFNAEIKKLKDRLGSQVMGTEDYRKTSGELRDIEAQFERMKAYASGEDLIDTSGKGNLFDYLTVSIKNMDMEVPKALGNLETLEDRLKKVGDAGRSISNIMSNMGAAVGGSAGEWLKYGANVVQSCTQAYQTIVKLIPALEAQAIAEAAAQASGLGPLGWLTIGAAVASVIAAFASMPAFANGGIVGGNDHSDGILARVSSGEMILNQGQQRNLFNMINSGGGKQVEFVIRGRDLVGVERNYSSKMSKVK